MKPDDFFALAKKHDAEMVDLKSWTCSAAGSTVRSPSNI